MLVLLQTIGIPAPAAAEYAAALDDAGHNSASGLGSLSSEDLASRFHFKTGHLRHVERYRRTEALHRAIAESDLGVVERAMRGPVNINQAIGADSGTAETALSHAVRAPLDVKVRVGA